MGDSRIRTPHPRGPTGNPRISGQQHVSAENLHRSRATPRIEGDTISLPNQGRSIGGNRVSRKTESSLLRLYLVTEREDVGVLAQKLRDILCCRIHVAKKPIVHDPLAERQRELRDEFASLTLREMQAIQRSDCVLAIVPGGSMELGYAMGFGVFTACIGAYTSALRGLIQYHADSIEEFCASIEDLL